MANNNENERRWVEDRLKALDILGEFHPDAAQAGVRLRMREAATDRRARWTWATMAAAVLCLAPLAFPAPRSFAQRVLNLVLQVEVAEMRPPAPNFTLTDADGKVVKLSDYKGKVVLLNFWATWCTPCEREIPWFMEFEQTYKDRGFAVLGVSVDEDGWNAVRPYISEKRVNYPVMISNIEKLPEPYGKIGALPMTYLLDRQGRIAGTHNSLATKAAYEDWILELLDK